MTVEPAGLKVNGVPIPRTRVLERDSKGRPVPHPRWGEHPVAEGTVWLVSTYTPQSWDSRYFGPIPVGQVLSVAEGVLTEESGRPSP